MNMLKPDFLYKQGMKILVCSQKGVEAKRCSWQRAGSAIAYYKNSIHKKGTSYYTLTFTLTCDCTLLCDWQMITTRCT